MDDTDDTETVRPTSTVGSAVFKVIRSMIIHFMPSFVPQLRKIVRHVRSSPQRRKTWQKEVRDCANAAPGTIDSILMLILDVKTRWSSTHQMLRTCSVSSTFHWGLNR